MNTLKCKHISAIVVNAAGLVLIAGRQVGEFLKLGYQWILFKMKLVDHSSWPYCPKCTGCGYIECCPAKQCKPGFGCAGYYSPEELDGTIQSEQYPEEVGV